MKKYILILIAAVVLIGIIQFVRSQVNDIQEFVEANKAIKSTYIKGKFDPEYRKLFKSTINLTSIGTLYSQTRNPICEFNRDNRFYVNITKLGYAKTLPLSKVVHFDSVKETHITYHVMYHSIHSDYLLNVRYRAAKSDTVANKLYLNVYGNNTIVSALNDSTYHCYSNLESFSIRYAPQSSYDVFIDTESKRVVGKIPTEIALLVRNHSIYLIFMAAVRKDIALNSGQLLKLLN